jgi:hypothetical protein
MPGISWLAAKSGQLLKKDYARWRIFLGVRNAREKKLVEKINTNILCSALYLPKIVPFMR